VYIKIYFRNAFLQILIRLKVCVIISWNIVAIIYMEVNYVVCTYIILCKMRTIYCGNSAHCVLITKNYLKHINFHEIYFKIVFLFDF